MKGGLASAAALALIASGCGDDRVELQISPSSAEPGTAIEIVTVGASTETTSMLELQSGDTWEPRYVLSSAPKSIRAIKPGADTTAFGLGLKAGATESIDLPAGAPPGHYRLVKRASVDGGEPFNVTAELDITE